jgi:TRAP-type mannitol/chloroaromatic compound transport system permease large subunit
MRFLIKTLISALIITAVSTLSKKVPLVGALIISLPITSMLALTWLYIDTSDTQKVIQLSNSISLMVIPSIIFFIALSLLLKYQVKMHYSMLISSVLMILAYSAYTFILCKIGIKF